MNSKGRCAGCKEYFPRAELKACGMSRVCSDQCAMDLRKARRAKPKRGPVGKRRETNPEWTAIRNEVRERDSHRCRYCGSRDMIEVHHVAYRSQGGPDWPSNLITLCQAHHMLAHSNKKKWQSILRATIWLHYVEGRFLRVPEVEKLVASTDK